MNEKELERRINDLDRRITSLETALHDRFWQNGNEAEIKAAQLLSAYGEYVDKSLAAKILGVTRATVYTMIADGRIEAACGGKRVSVRSIARYMVSPKTPVASLKERRAHHESDVCDD